MQTIQSASFVRGCTSTLHAPRLGPKRRAIRAGKVSGSRHTGQSQVFGSPTAAAFPARGWRLGAMHRPGPGGDGGLAYGGSYGGGGYGGDELALALRGLALGGEHLPGSPYDAYAHAAPGMSPRAAGQDAFNDASAHADLLFDAQDVSWLRAAYGQGFDPERLLAGDIMQAEHARQPMSPGYHRRVPPRLPVLGDCIAAASCEQL